jgi:uncharacterized membrane protein
MRSCPVSRPRRPAIAPGGGQRVACVWQEGAARRGEGHASAAAVEQRLAQLPLQAADLLADRRLGDLDTLCGPSDVAFFGDRDEVRELPQFHKSCLLLKDPSCLGLIGHRVSTVLVMTSQQPRPARIRRPLHPPLVHIPIGGVVAATICDIVSTAAGSGHSWARTWYQGGSIALMIGTGIMFLAIGAGLIDRSRRVPRSTTGRPGVNRHAIVMSVLTATCILDITLRNDRYPHVSHTPAPVLITTMVALALTVAGGELGGRVVYRHVVYRHHEASTALTADEPHGGHGRTAPQSR